MHILNNEHINENHLSLARHWQEPSDNLPPDDEVDETPQESGPVDDMTTSSSSAPFLAAHSSAHGTIDSATEPIALSTPSVATPITTNHIGNLLEAPRDTSQNSVNLFSLKDTGIFFQVVKYLYLKFIARCSHYSRQGHSVALSPRQTARAVQDHPN